MSDSLFKTRMVSKYATIFDVIEDTLAKKKAEDPKEQVLDEIDFLTFFLIPVFAGVLQMVVRDVPADAAVQLILPELLEVMREGVKEESECDCTKCMLLRNLSTQATFHELSKIIIPKLDEFSKSFGPLMDMLYNGSSFDDDSEDYDGPEFDGPDQGPDKGN